MMHDFFQDEFLRALGGSSTEDFQLPVLLHFRDRDFHGISLAGEWDSGALVQEFGGCLCRSIRCRKLDEDTPGAPDYRDLLFRLGPDLFLHLAGGNELKIYASTREAAEELATRLTGRFHRRATPEEPVFRVLAQRDNWIDTERVPISKPFVTTDEELDLHYGDGFSAWQERFLEMMTTSTSGLTLFRGAPGTGKTSYIRYLVWRLRDRVRFYFLPATYFGLLSNPGLVQFWIKENRQAGNQKNVVIIEDAESLVVDRNDGNQEAISSLLNLGDGMMGETIKVHLLCTFNCHVHKLDPAILRPGRLLAYREFGRLPPQAALRLAERKGWTLPPANDYSLAELYHAGRIALLDEPGRRIGFAARHS